MDKIKLGIYWAAGCGGCDIGILEIHEKLLELVEKAEIVFWPCIMDSKYADLENMADGSIDVCLFNGSIRTEENLLMANLLRKKSKALVAFGSCAAIGGIPGLANLFSRKAIYELVYKYSESNARSCSLPETTTDLGNGMVVSLSPLLHKVKTLAQVVEVDYFVPGCPPAEEQVWNVLEAFLRNDPPPRGSIIGSGAKSVCDECSRKKKNGSIAGFKRIHEIIPDEKTCLMEQGLICMGPATRSGCKSPCPEAGIPCRGCYGMAGDTIDAGAKIISVISSLIASNNEQEIAAMMEGLCDPVGTLYRFSLPASVLPRSRE
jgi:F420-non-reducing hydrogenase small subunit